MPFDLTGRAALVTGSSSGLGAAMARCLSEAGADVAVNYTSEKSLGKAEAVAEYIRSRGRRAMIVRADVSCEEEVRRMVDEVAERFGRLDILCNNAGVNSSHTIFDLDLEEWQRVLNVNLNGAFLCSKYAIPYMQKNHYGRIIMTSSIVAQQGTLFGQVHYGASKGAQQSFAKTLARTVAQDGITVNCVAPGSHLTETLQEILINSDPSRIEETIARIPMKRLGSCEDVGYAVTFLASEEAGYITGACIDVNGGAYMRA